MAFNNKAYMTGGEETEASWVTEIEMKRSSPPGGTTPSIPGPGKDQIGILGSGDFGRALAGRLAQAGYTPVIGSRDPHNSRPLMPAGVEVSSVETACRSSIIIVAVPYPFYHTLPAHLLQDKILVDVSNRSTVKRNAAQSQAEYLASLNPSSRVVKAFNVLSAYALESGGLQGSKQVYLAGDCADAKERVSALIRGAGFTPVDLGALTAAATIEDIPVSLFPSWRKPFIVHIALFIFLYLLSFAKFQICWPLTWSETWLWDHIPMDNVNKTLAVHALVSLALCYLPGVIAAWIQIVRATKYSRFPNWLDQWLKMRKQLGLLMLFAASIHACLSVAIMSPTYQDIVYGQPKEALIPLLEGEGWGPKTLTYNNTVKIYGSEKMDWRGECFLISGVFGFGLVVVLGLSSLPSVTQTLSWKEFAWIQSGLGWSSLVILCAHDMFYGWPYLDSPSCYIPSSFQYALYVPGLTVLMKLPLLVPPLSTRLVKIRAGYVRGAPVDKPSPA